MDNPQHYQPLSHALHPPQAQVQHSYVTPGMYHNKSSNAVANTHRAEEEEEEEEEDDEGIVEEQLNRNEPDGQGSSASPQAKATGIYGSTTETHSPHTQQSTHDDQTSQGPDRKRRPGRPRGSKNRKPRVSQTGSKSETPFYAHGQPSLNPAAGTTPPQHPDVNVHNQQYYEFQWRVLNLCAEFYGAAEELVKGTPPLVIAQCYQMGPGSSVDPLNMLGDAKRICDTLLANPSQLISSPPPPMYTVVPSIYKPVTTQPTTTAAPTTSAHATSSTTKSATPATMISNPQSFVVPLSAPQTGYPAQYPMYAPPPGQYPTTPYYHQYASYPHPTPAFYAPQPQPITQPQPQPQSQPTQPPASQSQQSQTQSQPQSQTPSQPPQTSPPSEVSPVPAIPTTSSGTVLSGNQGAWSDEETERLKKLAEDSRAVGSSGEIEWDWVVHQWGAGRTRHQILIKATSLGLKESTSRGVKRRREAEGNSNDVPSPSVPPTPTLMNSTHAVSVPPSASPAQSHAASTPAASPALQHQQRPPQKSSSISVTPSSLPWPMPTVAVNTPSPVVATTTVGQQDQQRTSYYRPRPTQNDSSKSASGTHGTAAHQYMYQPNGNSSSGSRLVKENGK